MKHQEKIKGAIFGFALGDALGVGAEFMTRNEIRNYYPGGLHRFEDIIRDAHRIQWLPGEWTNDTEIITPFLETILGCGGFDIHAIALSLKKLVSSDTFDGSPLLRTVCKAPDWEKHPIAAAHKVWQSGKFVEATNEATQRGIVTGITSRYVDLMEHTRRITLITNDDNRCVSTGMILARTAHSLLWDEKLPDFEDLVDICEHIDPRTLQWLEKTRVCKIEDLELDDVDTLSYTRKAMCAGLWPLWHSSSATETFDTVIAQGGDADSNAAIAGALAGLRYGYDALPAEKEKLLRFDYLNDLAERVAEYSERQGR